MSDSEFDEAFEIPTKAKARREPATAARNSRTDSDVETQHSRDPISSISKATIAKRKATSRAPSKTASAAKKKITKELDLFGLGSDDEEPALSIPRPQSNQLQSSLSSKVADGCIIRRAQHDGRYYAEVRVYLTKDALDTRPELRYTKALATLKLQLDEDRPEWELLQKVFKKSKTAYFTESKPVFYPDKK